MNLVFDGSAHPLGLVLPSLLGLIPLAIWLYERYLRKRPSTWILPAMAALVFFGINGLSLWDQLRVRRMLETGDGIQVTEGSITESWHIESRVRDWSKANLSYKRIVSEGFDAGGVRFKWNVGDSFSPATFSNSAEPAIAFIKGVPVQVTWFVDPAAEHDRRIIRLRMGRGGHDATSPDASFEGYRAKFLSALSARNDAALNDLTMFPLAFGGHPIDRGGAENVWAGLTMPGLLDCLPAARAQRAPDGALSLSCHGISLVFRKGSAGWLLHEVQQGR